MYSVKGSLHKHLSWWREHIKNPYIVKTVEEGYRLPLINVPKNDCLRNKNQLERMQTL